MNDPIQKKAHVIVISNEKGGTGKSTISMHLAIKLMQEGFRSPRSTWTAVRERSPNTSKPRNFLRPA